MEFGTKIVGKTKPIPKVMLTDSVIGSVYEIRIKTSPISNQKETASLLVTQLQNKFYGLKVHYINIDYEQISIQLTGSPFMWGAVLLFLPTILGAIGITTLLIGVYLIFSQIPGWIIGLIVLGGALTFLGPKIGEWVIEGIPTIQET